MGRRSQQYDSTKLEIRCSSSINFFNGIGVSADKVRLYRAKTLEIRCSSSINFSNGVGVSADKAKAQDAEPEEREAESWHVNGAEVDVKRSMEEGEGEKCFNQLSIEERGKFDEETLVNTQREQHKKAKCNKPES
ncbi:hypothetical protein RJ639_019119 [Escallonia herrerae]|uniref:Uncharacterized protein n=1 Tax=Escallonia herrerae TaxID=1293975 RepID=A0AA88V9Q4_9ASTE|nr:hypothetical protein RJ639_019119 [Escallonia herrerae]